MGGTDQEGYDSPCGGESSFQPDLTSRLSRGNGTFAQPGSREEFFLVLLTHPNERSMHSPTKRLASRPVSTDFRAWCIVILLFLLTTVNFVDRMVISSVGPIFRPVSF